MTESAALGFEFGYNIRSPERLAIWEAQYGDFVNIAQGILDEFLVSARDKWGQTPSLVLLLPHGNEGQGPDHSSARPERLLQLAAETNLRLANPTTAAQYFHLLRRQAGLLKTDPLPLIILTPKGLLRHPMVSSKPVELAEELWKPVLDDPLVGENRNAVRRMILCSGRIYFDLATSDLRKENQDVAIARVEQLYPLPSEEILAILESYPGVEHVTWVQEEPLNMGAWEFMKLNLADLLGERWPLRYVGRAPSSSPAEGSTAWHLVNQKLLIERAYSKKVSAAVSRVIMEGV